MFALDTAQFHKTDTVLATLPDHDIKPPIFPGGCTALIHLLNVLINGLFKSMLQDCLDSQMNRFSQEALEYLHINQRMQHRIGEL